MELQAGQAIIATPLATSQLGNNITALDGLGATVYGSPLPTHHARAIHLIATTDQQITVQIRRYSAGGVMLQDSTGVVIAAGATGVQVLRDTAGDWIGDTAALVITNASGFDATVSYQLLARS